MPTYTDPGFDYLTELPNLEATATRINQFNQNAQTQANQARLGPQGVATQATALENAQREAQGLLDPETESMLQQGIAESGIGSGMGVDSANLASAYRRALGLDIAATEALGQKNYLDLLAANPAAPLFDFGGLLTTPQNQPDPSAGGGTGTGSGTGGDSTGTGGTTGGGATPSSAGALRRSASPLIATPAQSNASTGGAGYPSPAAINYGTPFVATTPGATLDWSGQDWGDLFGNPYNPTGASTVFGDVSLPGGTNYDMWDPFYGTSVAQPEFGSFPDYSSPGIDPIGAALGWPSVPGTTPLQNTVYNPATDTTDFSYYENYYPPNEPVSPAPDYSWIDPWAEDYG